MTDDEKIKICQKEIKRLRCIVREYANEIISGEIPDTSRQIAIIWDIDDVKSIRPHLNDEQAMEVLENVKRKHDAELGVTWQTLEIWADELFPEEDRPYKECDSCKRCDEDCFRYKGDADGNCINREEA